MIIKQILTSTLGFMQKEIHNYKPQLENIFYPMQLGVYHKNTLEFFLFFTILQANDYLAGNALCSGFAFDTVFWEMSQT